MWFLLSTDHDISKEKCIELINYIDTRTKCHHLKKLTCKGRDFAGGVYLSEAALLLVFFLGWAGNFVGSESGHSRVLNSFRIWSPTGFNRGGEG
jgi:hypothetical protein